MTAVSELPRHDEAESLPPTAERSRGRWFVAAGVPTVLTGFHGSYYGAWIVDDAGLSFAYARSLATGSGAVLQPGTEPVEGYSNPAWVALLVVGRWLGLFDRGTLFGLPDVVMYPKLIALLCCFGIFAAVYAIASTVTQRPVLVTVIAGAMTAAVPSFAIWTTSGLENALFALAVTALAAVLVRGAVNDRLLANSTVIAAGLLAALAALTRPDGIVYMIALPLAAAVMIRGHSIRAAAVACAKSFVAAAIPLSVYLVWRLVTFGDYLPNTARAKEQGLPSVTNLTRIGELVGYIGIFPVCVAAGVVVAALRRPSLTRTAIVMMLIPLGLAVLGFVVLRPDWMVQLRFATPVWPLAAIVLTLSVAQVTRTLSTRAYVVTVVLLVIPALSTMNQLAKWNSSFLAHPTVGVCNVAQTHGYLFNGYADILGIRDGTLLAVDGGGTSLTSRLRFVDLSGLADRRIARFWHDDNVPGLRDYIFNDVRPTFIKVFAFWAERERLALTGDPRFARDYLLMFAGARFSGEWVRRDAIPDRTRLKQARQWGRASWDLANSRYPGGKPPEWWCGNTLRPTPFRSGTAAPSPLTEG